MNSLFLFSLHPLAFSATQTIREVQGQNLKIDLLTGTVPTTANS